MKSYGETEGEKDVPEQLDSEEKQDEAESVLDIVTP